jgi:replicative superfamily II helicase
VIGTTGADRLASWLNVRLIEESARPVDLLRGVAASGSLAYRSYNCGTDGTEPFADISLAEDSADSIIDLLRNLEGSTLVFLKSRMDTVRLAFRLAAAVNWPAALAALESLADEEPSFLARSLRQALNRGVAFHNSDLTPKQRNAVEQAFAQKEIRVLFSTTTLAMGVNLPAETVFLETVKYVGGDYDGRPVIVPITRAEFENMTGRAGRLGLANGKPGRAIVLAQSDFDRDILWQQYIAAGPPGEIVSAFESLESADWLLPMIACRLVRARDDIRSVYEYSFHSHIRENCAPDLEGALDYLVESELVKSDRSGNVETTPFGRVSATSGMTIKQAVYYRDLLVGDQPETEFGWLALALSGPDWDLPPGILSRAELADNTAVRLIYRDFDHAIDDARYILPPDHCHQPLNYRQAAVLKSLLLLSGWTRCAPARRLEEQYQIHLGQIHALGETAAHLVGGLGALLGALDRNSRSIGKLRELAFSLRFGLSPALRELHRHLGSILNRADFLSLENAGIGSMEQLISADSSLGEVLASPDKLMQIHKILDKYKQEVSMNTSQHSVVSAGVAEPELVEIDGTFDRERYLVKINGYPVRLTGKSFKYFTKLAWSRLKRDSGWVYKEDIEVGFNQARYLYRMKNEINANLSSNWPIVENNRLGYYRLDIDPEKIRINTQNLSNHPDYEIRSLVVPEEVQSGGKNPSIH